MRAVALACLFLALGACRRPDGATQAQLQAQLAGAWLHEARSEPGKLEGLHLRPDGSVALLGTLEQNGLAWNLSRDVLVISTNSERAAEPRMSRLRVVTLTADGLELERDEGDDSFAGQYRRAQIASLSGVVTYRERIALPPGARVEVRLLQRERAIARSLISASTQVPIPFALSYLPDQTAAGSLALDATIRAPDGLRFATPAPVPVSDEQPQQLLLERARD